MRKILFVLAVGSGILLASSAAIAADNWVGTWKLNSYQNVWKKGGKVTITRTGTDAQGRDVNTIGVYDKQ